MQKANSSNSMLRAKSARKVLLKRLDHPWRKIMPIDSYSPGLRPEMKYSSGTLTLVSGW
jgi:hypothetical protein